MTEKWTLDVEHAMGCNCNWACPCSYESPPTYGTCEAALVYRVRQGKHGQVPLDGLCWLTVAARPGPLHEGNGRAVVFIDGEEHRVSTLLHTGMLNKVEDHYSVRALEVDADGMTFSYRGRNAFTSLASWQGP